jgi:hypothetical protein
MGSCCGFLVLKKLGGRWSDAGSLSCEDSELRRLWARVANHKILKKKS